MGSLFTQGAADWGSGGGGGTDWGGLIGGLGAGVIGIFQQKQQNRALKRMNRLRGGGYNMSGGGGGYYNPQGNFVPQYSNTFAPGVPAAGVGSLGGWGAAAGAAGAIGGLLGLGPDILPGGLEEGGTGMFGPDLFKPTNGSSRQRMIDAVNPDSGERQFWRPVGKPLMFTGDAAILKRTRKMVRKMSSSAGCAPQRSRFRRRR